MAGKKRKLKKGWIVVIVLVIGLGVLGFLRTRSSQEHSYSETTAAYGNIRVTFSFTGEVTAPNVQTIQSPVSAGVRDTYCEVNSIVHKGDRLVRLDDGTLLKAEMDGELTQLAAKKGDYVQQGKTLCTIMDLSRLEVEISVDEYDIGAIAVGKEVDALVTATDLRCGGVITAFNKQANRTGQMAYYNATVLLEKTEGILPGMQVEISLVKDEADNVLLLRQDALQYDDNNLPYVLVSDGQKGYVHRPVTVGVADGTQVQILSGLAAGETVYFTDRTGNIFFVGMQNRGGSR
ncbi:MAG: HlyD family efflux transporter periplasmic adaptor subunit [Clostridia bacterium]|nr:HlyD family efflux transporter periplasmic adaptor subunit [Clostridia bacterium]